MTFTYLVTYLAIGGIGFALFPAETLALFFSNGDYGDIMPRMVGLFMSALSFLLYNMLKKSDWSYYSATIYLRSAIVLFLTWMYFKSNDPLFITINVIVLIGLIPSIIVQIKSKDWR